jgi:predicted RNase H-like HicB family nuclease
MNAQEFVYWQDEGMWLGYLKEYPDYWTQGQTLEELKENLKDIFIEIIGGSIPNIRKTGELEIA